MTDSKYFTTNKKGEIFELKAELNNEKKEKRKEAVKKVIAAMTVGKDVSSLFPDVVNCMQTDNLELKKLVYLYLMNYAKSQPDMAIMAVNSFVKPDVDPCPAQTARISVSQALCLSHLPNPTNLQSTTQCRFVLAK
ncbi:AP-2 complex subunit beta-like isoform X2 [Manis pentadactyla]|uniref:AP-2 complex subunit beta-like isoform X2 n=1 Tax=Manis pentadactyla TaxID=143292 RepID=UPI00255CB076|nr:AP-2 complex subunit beta-like isoform X2 [Manis pentadactyla]